MENLIDAGVLDSGGMAFVERVVMADHFLEDFLVFEREVHDLFDEEFELFGLGRGLGHVFELGVHEPDDLIPAFHFKSFEFFELIGIVELPVTASAAGRGETFGFGVSFLV